MLEPNLQTELKNISNKQHINAVINAWQDGLYIDSKGAWVKEKSCYVLLRKQRQPSKATLTATLLKLKSQDKMMLNKERYVRCSCVLKLIAQELEVKLGYKKEESKCEYLRLALLSYALVMNRETVQTHKSQRTNEIKKLAVPLKLK